MRLQAAMFALFLLLALVPPIYAIQDACDACNQVILRPTLSGTNISVQAHYMNFSYYNELQHLTKQSDYQNPSAINVPSDVLTRAFNANLSPLKNAPLFFKLENYIFVDASNNPVCNPENTSEQGIASCNISFYRNSSNLPAPIQKLSKCMNVFITYEGHSNDVQYKPANANVIVCGDNNNALSQIGREISLQVDSNKEACVPVFILLGVLLAAMYYSGKNPLSLFDITTPRFPATRKFRMARTGVMVGFTEKALMGKRIMKMANKSLGAVVAREVAGQMGRNFSKTPGTKESKEIMKKVEKILNDPKKSSKQKYSEIEALVRGRITDKARADKAMRAVQQLYNLYSIAEEDAKKSSFARGARPADYKDAKGEYKNLVGSGAGVRGGWVGGKITEFMSGTHKYKYVPKINYLKVPLIKQTFGNLAIVTAQNLNVWGAVRRIRREAIGSAVGNTARRVFGANEKTRFIGGVVEKYNPENKKFSTFTDEVYKLARDAAAAHDELKREELRNMLHEMLGKDLAEQVMKGKNVSEWQLSGAADRLKNLSKADREQLALILNDLHTYSFAADPKSHYEHQIQEVERILQKKLSDTRRAEIAKQIFEINALGAGLFTQKDGKTIRIIDSDSHLKALDPKIAKEAMQRIIDHVATHDIRNPAMGAHGTMLGASMPLRMLEEMAYNTQNAKLSASAQAWLLNFMREHLAGAKAADGSDKASKLPSGPMDAAKFKEEMHKLLSNSEFEGLRKRLSELDHWDLRNSYEHFNGAQKKDAYEALLALRERIEKEVVSRHFMDTLLSGGTDFKSPLEQGDRFNPMRMAFERAFGRQESKFSFREEYCFWSINRMQGRIETVDAANMYGYFNRSADRNLNQLDWLTNWWLVSTKEGKERLKSLLPGNEAAYDMDAKEYRDLMERGVLFKDIKKGLWMSSSDFQANPMALLDIERLRKSGAKFNSRGDLEFNNDAMAKQWKEAWKEAYMPRLSISERFLNQYMLANPQDKKTGQYEADTWQRLGSDAKSAAILQSVSGHGKTARDTRQADRYGKQATEVNLNGMQEHHMLVSRDMFASSSEFGGRKDLGARIFGEKGREKIHSTVGGFLEDVAFGATYYNTIRLQNWFESQTRMRATLQDYQRALSRGYETEDDESNELKSAARKKYEKEKENYAQKMSEFNAKSITKSELDVAQRAYEAATKAWRKSGIQLESDRHLNQLNKQLHDYMQVSERASMRDPRVAHSGIGINQPFGAGYHTGQQMYEPAESVFAFGILPDQDLVHRFTYRLAYRVNYEFVTRSRGMFGMIAGYPVRGDIYEGAPVAQQYSFSEAFRSAFKLGMNDWFAVRWNRPYQRDFSETYKHPLQQHSIFGLDIKDNIGMADRIMFPITMANPGSSGESKDAFRMGMLKKGWTQDQIDNYFGREEYALSETYERRIKRLLSPEGGNYKAPWYANMPIVSDLFGQGYYTAIKRTGDAYTAHGESMRDNEFYSPVYRNMSKAFPPGMMYEDWAGSRYHLMPRLAGYALNFGELARTSGALGMEMQKSRGGKESYATMLRRDANADVWVTTTHALALAAEREHEAVQFSPLRFSATIFATSPGLGLLNMGKNIAKSKIQKMQNPDEHPSFFANVKDELRYLVEKNYDENRVICANGHKHTRGTTCPVCESLAARNKMALVSRDQSYSPKDANRQMAADVNGLKADRANLMRNYGNYLNS